MLKTVRPEETWLVTQPDTHATRRIAEIVGRISDSVRAARASFVVE